MISSANTNTSFRKFLIFISLFSIIICNTNSTALASKENSIKKNLLILCSNNEENTWESNIVSSIKNNFGKSNITVNYNIEYFASIGRGKTLMSDEENNSYILSYLHKKYGNTKFDAVLAVDDEALNFVGTNYYNSIFQNTSIIYCGINDSTKRSSYPYNMFTGIVESYNSKQLVDNIISAHPNVKVVNILLDSSIYCKEFKISLLSNRVYYSDHVIFNFITSDYIENITSELTRPHGNQVNIIAGVFKDNKETFLEPASVVDKINAISKCPIYTTLENYADSNITGGLTLSGTEHGKCAYNILSKVFNGESVRNLNPIYDSKCLSFYTYEGISSYGIDMGSLPSDTTVKDLPYFKKPTFRILAISAIIIIICILVIIIQVQRRRKQAKIAMLEKQRYEEMVKYDNLKSEFLANISHEFRTPLNVMLSSIQLLELYNKNGDMTFKEPRHYENLNYIKQNCFRLLRLVNNLIDTSKIDAGYFKLNMRNENIVEVVEDITLSVATYVESKGIELVFDTNEEEKTLFIDKDKMERIMLNLLSNSAKFTPENGSIFVTVTCEEYVVYISVKDTGIGIPLDQQASIFDRFTQVDNSLSRKREGSGIGLSLVKSLVELHHGKIELKSDVNKGCEFIITLPVYVSSSDGDHSEMETMDNSKKVIMEFSDIEDISKL